MVNYSCKIALVSSHLTLGLFGGIIDPWNRESLICQGPLWQC